MEKRAVTAEEHAAIVASEANPERRAYYESCWHLGGAQTDVALLNAGDIDWANRVVSFRRKKTGTISIIRFGERLEAVLQSLPRFGPLFSHHRLLLETHRGTAFRRACRRVGVSDVTLHCYRYAWAERAKTCGYPELYAQEALAHPSKAIHRAYARKASFTLPPLEEFEKAQAQQAAPPMPKSDRLNDPMARRAARSQSAP